MFLGSIVSMVASVGVFCACTCSKPLCETLCTYICFRTTTKKQFFYISSCREVLRDSVAFFYLPAAEYKYIPVAQW